MEKVVIFMRKSLFFLVIVLAFAPVLMAQSLNTMGLNGATGLYTTPTGRIGWSQTDLGLDLGYHALVAREDLYDGAYGYGYDDRRLNHIPKFSLSIFKWVEAGVAFDIQPPLQGKSGDERNNTDLIFDFKVQLPTKTTAVAIGGNFQTLNLGSSYRDYNALQLYLATTYAGTFFSMPAETTVALGKTFIFREHYDNTSDFDFGMGFDLVVFPKTMDNLIHWVIDFSNFSYSANPWGADASHRGTLNTGLRFDLGSFPSLSKYKFVIDVALTDAFDVYYRSFSFGMVIGIPLQ
jgi:hypothetical protein